MAEFTIMVTGAGGQLGQELVRLRRPGIRWVGFSRQELDITDADACRKAVAACRPDAVIHAAAFTAVDRAETELDAAWAVNAGGTRNMAEAAEAAGARFCYISTDYVFDGKGARPYREEDPAAPQSVYGRTKLEGERAALDACSRTFIVRTSWVYGRYGNNFVRTMLRMAQTQSVIRVVNDQTGSPTCTYDLAQFLTQLVQTERYGVYHASNSGSCTWFQFAQAIFEQTGLQVQLHPCSTEEFPRPAPRPAYSVLGHEAMERAGFPPMRHWREALREYLASQK